MHAPRLAWRRTRRTSPARFRLLAPLWSFAMHALLVPLWHSLGAQVPATTLKSADLWFDAKASLGPFRGITHQAKGETAAAASLTGVHGFVEMEATTLTTSNGMRDRDMRKTLDVDVYPRIRFELDSVAVRSQAPDSAVIELVGRMSIHGVTRMIRIPANLRRRQDEIRVSGSYELFLPDYGVTKLKRMLGVLSMDPTIRVGFDVTFSGARTGAEDRLQ